jgi:ABC-type lipoprotein export system ATPase subunit
MVGIKEPPQAMIDTTAYENGNQQLIELRKVAKSYKTAVGDFVALKEIDLNVDAGEFVAVIGKSGSGKSTLVNMLTGIDRPTSGEVLIGDTAVHLLKEGQIAQWRGRTIGIVFQFFQLLPTLTIAENVMLPMDFCNMYARRERAERAMHLLELVDIADHAHKLPTAVSGGQQQRAAIARALANDPPIVMADEPTGNLDSRTAAAVFDLFQNLVESGKTILMVTHDEGQARRASRTIVLADGEIVNEYLAKALPFLSQDQMVKATHKLEAFIFSPGEVIVLQDAPPDRFYIIKSGEVHIYLRQPDGAEILVDTLRSGQYFGEVALLRGGVRTATVRSSRKDGVEVVALNQESFNELVSESPVTRSDMDRVMAERAAAQARLHQSTTTQEDEP